MMKCWIKRGPLLALSLLLAPGGALAEVSPQDAATLKTTLTPVGAERAGNAEGTIPAWNGGFTTAPAGYKSGAPRPDPFSDDKPVLILTGTNAKAYADKLPEGALALFAKYPDYRMDVYPARRSAAAPQRVYDAIFQNATRAHAAPEGIAYGVEGAAGGIPFPIPKNGYEAMWNHLLAFWGPAREAHLSTYVVSAAGDIDLASAYQEIADFPYYTPDAAPDGIARHYFKTRHVNDAPAARADEAYLAWQPLNIVRDKFAAWRYLPGERRVRRAPSLSYDTPDPDASGFQSLDEYYMFFGGLDRYDFKLVGKKEIYIPYNNNRFYGLPARTVLHKGHAAPDALRYELHRVWVVEGSLLPGKHHVAPRRRLYIDEDTWFIVYSESWDEDGKLWKFGHATMYLMPDVPAVILGSQFVYDLQLGGYVLGFAFNGEQQHYKVTAPHPPSAFTVETLATQAGQR